MAISSRQNITIKHDVKKQADPLEKDGLVGAFCKAYSIEDAVGNFLSNIYKERKWRYYILLLYKFIEREGYILKKIDINIEFFKEDLNQAIGSGDI